MLSIGAYSKSQMTSFTDEVSGPWRVQNSQPSPDSGLSFFLVDRHIQADEYSKYSSLKRGAVGGSAICLRLSYGTAGQECAGGSLQTF